MASGGQKWILRMPSCFKKPATQPTRNSKAFTSSTATSSLKSVLVVTFVDRPWFEISSKTQSLFPVRHYNYADLAIAEGLKTYLENCGCGAFACSCLRALTSIARSDALESRCGVQTYLGYSFFGEKLKLTSYVAPEVCNLQP